MITPIARIEGTVADIGPDGVVVMVGGVGYGLQVPATAIARLRIGQSALLHTHLALREDGAALYGFITTEERGLFETLIGVAGIGPRGALGMLSAISPRDLLAAVATGDIATLKRLPGVGPKTAGRIVLELRGTLEAQGDALPPAALQDDALAALLALGYAPAEAMRALEGVDGGAEERIRGALQRIGGGR